MSLLSINPIAWKIYYTLLTNDVLNSIHHTFSAWYNGRERGICLCIDSAPDKNTDTWYVITFGECRNSDQIFVDNWSMAKEMNPPTIDDFDEISYKKRRTFEKQSKAVEYIFQKIQEIKS